MKKCRLLEKLGTDTGYIMKVKQFFRRKYKQVFVSERLTFKDRLALAIPVIPSYLVTLLIFNVLFKYFTDVAGIDPLVVGTVFMILSIWNAVNDPLIGILIDKMPNIIGRDKYLFIVKYSVPVIVIPIFLLVFVQGTWHEWVIYGYMLVMLVIYEAGSTAYSTSINCYIFARIHDTQERVEYSLISTYMNYIFSSVITLIPLLMFVDDRPSEYITPAILVVLTLDALLFWFSLRNLKDDGLAYDDGFVNEDAQLAKDIVLYTKDIFKSRGFWINSILSYLVGMSVAYYFTYYIYFVDDILNITGFQSFLIDTGNGVLAFLVIPIIPYITKKVGIKYACIIALIPGIIGFGLLYFTQGVALFTISFALIVISNTSQMVIISSPLRFLVIDEDWQRTGVRKVGYINALSSLMIKPANGFRAMILGAVLSYFGYVGGAAAQTETALYGIRVASSIVPFIILILSVIVVLFLPYNRKRENEIIALREQMEKDIEAATEASTV
ncbi:MFS transporter [Mollicutes bacterium LVI A0039]|nr:MFS transporter [Mollicutes bacterium LVI A0039]